MVGWRIALWAVLVVAALAFLYLVRSILLPFIVAILISVLLEPTIRKLRLRGLSRKSSVLLVWFSFMTAVVVIAVLFTPTIGRQIGSIRDKVDDITAQLAETRSTENFFVSWNPKVKMGAPTGTDQVDKMFEQYHDTLAKLGLPTTRKAAVEQYIDPHKKEITKAAETFFGGLLGAVTGFGSEALMMLFTPFFVLLILLDLEKFRRRAEGFIPPSIRADTIQLVQDIGDVFIRYLRGVSLVIILYILIASVLLMMLGAPYAILLAILFALIYLIPYIGPVVNGVLLLTFTGLSGKTGNFFLHFSTSWTYALTITVIYMAIMFLFDPLVYTRVVGNSVGLHPVVSFFVVFSGAALFGPIGMILAFPVAGSAKVILDRLLRITSRTAEEEMVIPAIPLRHIRT